MKLLFPVLVFAAVWLASCDRLAPNPAEEPPPPPAEVRFDRGIKPTTTLADGPWSWQSPTVGLQPLLVNSAEGSEDGKRLLVRRAFEDDLNWGESTDGGVTWSFGPEPPHQVRSPNMDHVVRLTTREISHDGGLSWTPLPEGAAGSDWVVSDSGEVANFARGGRSFSLLPLNSNWQTVALREGVTLEGLFVAAGGELLVDDVEYSSDGGTSWTPLLPAVGTTRLSGRIASDGTLSLLELKKTTPGVAVLVSRSTDHGVSWTSSAALSIEGPSNGGWLSSDGLRAVVGIRDRWAVVTWDGGVTWTSQKDANFEKIVLWGNGQGLLAVNHWLCTTSDGLMTLNRLRQPGNRLDGLVVAADNASVTGILHTPLGNEAWTTTDGLMWTVAEVPPPVPVPAKVKYVWALSPNGHHGLGATVLDSYHGGLDDSSWYARSVRIFHNGVVTQAAKVVEYVDWDDDDGELSFRGAVSADGSVFSVSILGDEGRWGNFISTDAGHSWWKSGDATVLAWSSNGHQGLGVLGNRLVTTADQGVSWSDLTGGAPDSAFDAVFFKQGLIITHGYGDVAFGHQELSQ